MLHVTQNGSWCELQCDIYSIRSVLTELILILFCYLCNPCEDKCKLFCNVSLQIGCIKMLIAKGNADVHIKEEP